MVGIIQHAFAATQAELTSNSAGAPTTWVGPNEWNSNHTMAVSIYGSTAGVSSAHGTSFGLGASQNLTASIDATSTVWFVGPQLSAFNVPHNGFTTTTFQAPIAGSRYVEHFVLPTEMLVSRVNLYGTFQNPGPWNGVTTSVSSTATHTAGCTVSVFFYSRGTGTDYPSFFLMTSGSQRWSYSGSISLSNTNGSATNRMTYPFGTGTQSSTSTAAAIGTINFSNLGSNPGNVGSNQTFGIMIPVTTTLPAGEYFLGFQQSTAEGGVSKTTPSAGFFQSNLGWMFAQAAPGSTFQQFGATGNSEFGLVHWQNFLAGTATSTFALSAGFGNMSTHSSGRIMAEILGVSTVTGMD